MNEFRHVVLFLLLQTSLSVFAASLSESDATRIALQFQQQQTTKKLRSTTLPHLVSLSPNVPTTATSKPAFYVYNLSDDQGFVIVSGETGTKSILGYSNEGPIQASNIPDNLKAWLNQYEQEITALRASVNNANNITYQLAPDFNAATPIVPPLLGLNRWTQLNPYNGSCPWDFFFNSRSAVGCVALAMGQIMHFHQWPTKPKGKFSYYVDNIGLQSVDFDAQTYDWSKMPSQDYQNSTAHQDALLANLLHHCGVSVRMQYSANGSGADVIEVGPAMVRHFDYDSDIQYYKREYFTNAAWESMLRMELDESRPVLYAAFNKTAGHVFVCDGYDSNNLFHINWGWGGNGNGYFELSSLNSNDPGVVGATEGFSKDQSMLVRIQRPDLQKRVSYSLGVLGGTVKGQTHLFYRDDTYFFRYECKNFGTNTFAGTLGLGYYDNNRQLRLLEKTATSMVTIPSGNTKVYEPYGLTLPSDLKEGFYQIFAIYRPSDSIKWSILPGMNIIHLQLGVDYAKFNYGNSNAKLELKSPINILHRVYQDQSAEVYATFMNYDVAFKSKLILDLYSLPDAKFVKTIYEHSHLLQANTVQTLQLKTKMTCPPGNYYLVLRSNSSNAQNFITRMEPIACNNLNILINPKPGPSDLQLVDSMSFQRNLSKQSLDSIRLNARVVNNGGFTNTILAGLIFSKDGEVCLDTISPMEYYIDSLETTTLSLKGTLDLQDGAYVLKLCQKTDSMFVPLNPIEQSVIPFVIGNPLARIDSLNLYWHLSNDQLIIDGDHSVTEIRLFDFSGIKQMNVENQAYIPVANLRKGIYILKVKMNNKIFMDKYVRK